MGGVGDVVGWWGGGVYCGVAVWRCGVAVGSVAGYCCMDSRVSMQSKANELATIAQLAIFWSCDVASSLSVVGWVA